MDEEDQWIYDNMISEEVNMNEENGEEPGVFQSLIVLMPSILLRYRYDFIFC